MTASTLITWGLQGVAEGAALACLLVFAFVVLVRLGAVRWLVAQERVFDFALAFMIGVVAAMAMTSCAHAEPVHGPHWWNCRYRVCNSDSGIARVYGAAYDANRHVCECYADDVRNVRQWIEVKP